MAHNDDDDSRLPPPPGFVMVRRGVTTDELREMFGDLRAEIGKDIDRGQQETHRRLDEVNRHLETLNGRVGRVEQDRSRLDEAVKNLGREVFGRRRKDSKGPSAPPPPSADEDKALTRRDLRTVLATLGMATAFWAFVAKVLPAILKAVAP